MGTYLLVVMFVFVDGFTVVGAEPFRTEAACKVEQDKAMRVASGLERGRMYVAHCVPIKVAGPSV